MKNIKLVIEYDGTNYYGWQVQPRLKTIQGEIKSAIRKITKEDVRLFGSGRTDKGVHANGQVANFKTFSTIPGHKFKHALNTVLPMDIVIKDSEEVDESFHSRFSATGKKYKYILCNKKTRSALLRNYTYHVSYDLDIKNMEKAASYFIGTHDFYGFKASGSAIKDTVRTIYSLDIEKRNELIEFNIEGNGFLYNMVRIIVGTIIKVGNNNISPESIQSIIKSKDRKRAGDTAPSQGLYLEKVYYDNKI
ncbi:MAG: tRNA pseudouridine(38-40) synthase TruA [Firmicutes bacterium]|nr:tRNA pseudouridine(38-40) synthase TruA [Bacillota bacterium]